MVRGDWDHVISDGAEDICCHATATQRRWIQVKTAEHPPTAWTPARISQPQGSGVDTSFLGKLFGDKDLEDDDEFWLLLNGQLDPALRPLDVDASREPRDAIEADIVDRLRAMTSIRARTIEWCVKRLWLKTGPYHAEDVERRLLSALDSLARSRGTRLNLDDLERVMRDVMSVITEAARATDPDPIDGVRMQNALDEAFRRALGGTDPSSMVPTKLPEKLVEASLLPAAVEKAQQMRARFVLDRRSSVPPRAEVLDEIADVIFVACSRLRAQADAGERDAGAALFAATVGEVERLHMLGDWGTHGVTLATAVGALHDITGRCQHHYRPPDPQHA
jgi:hypothetical protein